MTSQPEVQPRLACHRGLQRGAACSDALLGSAVRKGGLMRGDQMEIAVLREFVSLAENLNFSTTAKRLFITQSTLSRHIAALEHELGCRLFEARAVA